MENLLAKNNKIDKPVKASFWYTFCNFLQKGISFFVVPFYTRLLTTSEYGQYTTFSSWLNLLIIVATLNLYCGVYTKAMVDIKDERDKYTSSMQGLGSISTLILVIVYLANIGFWNDFLQIDSFVAISMFIYFLTYPSLSFWMTRQRVDFKYKKVVAITLIISIIYPMLSLLLIKTTHLGPKAIMFGYLWTQSSFGLFFYIYYFIRGKTFFNKDYWIKALKFNLPLLPHYISLVILNQTDKLMVQHYCGNSEAGIYGLSSQIGMVLSIVGSAITNSFVPWVYQKLKVKDTNSIKRVTSFLSLFVMVCCIGMVAITPELVNILGSSAYTKSMTIVPFIVGGYFFSFCYSFFANVEFYFSSTKTVMVATTISAVLNVLLNILFLPILGSVAAAITTVFCNACLCAFHFLASKYVLKKQGLNKTAFSFITLFSISIVGFIIISFLTLMFDNLRSRVGLILCLILFFIVVFYKKINLLKGANNGNK